MKLFLFKEILLYGMSATLSYIKELNQKQLQDLYDKQKKEMTFSKYMKGWIYGIWYLTLGRNTEYGKVFNHMIKFVE